MNELRHYLNNFCEHDVTTAVQTLARHMAGKMVVHAQHTNQIWISYNYIITI